MRNTALSKLIQWGFRNSRSYFICTNDGSYAELVSQQFEASKFFLLFNGVDKSLLRRKLPTSSGKKRVVYLSRVVENKGHMDFLVALHRSRISSSIEVIIIGNGSLLQEVKALVIELGLQNCVSFCGRLSHTEAMHELKKADLLVSLNYDGSFGNGVIEASQMGIPIITLSHIGCVTPHSSSFKVLPRFDIKNSAALAIKEILESRPTELKMSENSRNFSDKYLVSWDDRIDTEIGILSKIYNVRM